VIVLVVAPLLHRLPVVELDVKTVEPPVQKVLLPEIIGMSRFNVTLIELDTALMQFPKITLT
jgi:hypothetical protein